MLVEALQHPAQRLRHGRAACQQRSLRQVLHTQVCQVLARLLGLCCTDAVLAVDARAAQPEHCQGCQVATRVLLSCGCQALASQ